MRPSEIEHCNGVDVRLDPDPEPHVDEDDVLVLTDYGRDVAARLGITGRVTRRETD